MHPEALPQIPEATADLAAWEAYLQMHLSRKSLLKLRATRTGETPQNREQTLLRRLRDGAQESIANRALAELVPALQRQALQLIQLRRQLVPDESPAWQQGELYLAVGELHRAVHFLLDEIDTYCHHQQRLEQTVFHWRNLTECLVQGGLPEETDLQGLVREFHDLAADATLSPVHWVELCHAWGEMQFSTDTVMRRLALAGAMQSGYLLARILRKKDWLIDADSLLCAACFKDLAWFVPQAPDQRLERGHHAEWSAGLIAQVSQLPVAIPRLIRLHHECLDGSGLPFGYPAVQLRRDSQLLNLVTRWTELYCHHYQLDNRRILQRRQTLNKPLTVLLAECLQGRWNKEWLGPLLDQLGLPRPGAVQTSPVEYRRDANPHWHIPRPHFLATPQEGKKELRVEG